MENKSVLTFSLLSIISVLFLIGIASALTLDISAVTANGGANVAHNAGQFPISFSVTNTDASENTIALTKLVTTGTATITLSADSLVLAAGASQTVTGTVTFAEHQSGNIAGAITATSGADTDSASFTVPIIDAYTYTMTKTQDITASQNGIATLENTGNKNLILNLADTGAFDVTLSSTIVSLLAGATPTSITVVPTISTTIEELKFGPSTVTITATDPGLHAQTKTLALTYDKHFCSAGIAGTDLIIDSFDMTSTGDEDDEWAPLDEVTLDLTVKNVGTADMDDVIVELALFNSAGANVIGDVDFTSNDEEEVELGNLNDDEEEDVTWTFQIPADFEDGNYKVAVKVYSEALTEQIACDDNNDDLSNGYYQTAKVQRDDDNPVVVHNIVLSQDSAAAGDTVTMTFYAYNVGEDDQDQVKINVVNKDLGISIVEEIKDGIDAGDGEKLELTFTVPSGLKDGAYSITFTTEFDYDSRNDEYDKSSADEWKASLKVLGSSAVTPENELKVDVSASLESEAKAGEQLVVKATIKNNEATSQTIVIDAKDFADWAELDSISSRLLTLNAGESKEITFTFNVADDAKGEQTFTIEAIAGEKSETKEVAVTIAEKSSLFKGNSLIWIIGAINIVLIVLIIIVAVRLSRK